MGSILCSEVISRVQEQLFDINAIKWSTQELLGWLNDGQRQITIMVPESASYRRDTVQLSAGSEQQIPSDGWMLINVIRNMGPTPGSTPGRAMRLARKQTLEAFDPNWHYDTAVAAPTNWLFDPQSPTYWWCYPPSDGTGFVEVTYSQVPTDVGAVTDAIAINDIYEGALVDYILYRSASKNVPYAAGPEKAKEYWDAFTAGIGMKATAEKANDPNQNLGHPPPDEAGVQR